MATRTKHCSPAARAFAVSWFTTMTRSARLVSPECPHHVTQRGNRRQEVFRDDYDRRKFSDLLRQYIYSEPNRAIPEHIRLVQIDEDPWQLGKNYPVEVGVIGSELIVCNFNVVDVYDLNTLVYKRTFSTSIADMEAIGADGGSA